MKIDLPEDVCDSQVMIGVFPRLKDTFTLEELKGTMDKHKMQSVLAFSSYITPEDNTQEIIDMAKEDNRIYVLLRADPLKYLDTEYVSSMGKLIQTNSHVVGVKINSSTERHRPLSYIYNFVLRTLDRNHAILVLHCGRWVEMSSWEYGVELAKMYPNIKVILAHAGGTHPDLAYPAIESARNIKNIYMNTAQVRQTQVISRAIETLGSDRILFGSDMPWGNYVQNLVGILELKLSENVLNKVLRENFNRIIKGE